MTYTKQLEILTTTIKKVKSKLQVPWLIPRIHLYPRQENSFQQVYSSEMGFRILIESHQSLCQGGETNLIKQGIKVRGNQLIHPCRRPTHYL